MEGITLKDAAVAVVGAVVGVVLDEGAHYALKDRNSKDSATGLKETVGGSVDSLAMSRVSEDKLRKAFDKAETEKLDDLKKAVATRAAMAATVGCP